MQNGDLPVFLVLRSPFFIQMNTLMETNVRLFASANSWIEGEAVRQLYGAARLEGVRLAVGFPDLHPGKGARWAPLLSPRESFILTSSAATSAAAWPCSKRTWCSATSSSAAGPTFALILEHPWEGEVGEVLAAAELQSTEFDEALGTIGGGNHFAELQKVEAVLDAAAFRRSGLGKQQLVVLVHSGSRGFGESILRSYVDEHQAEGADADSFAAAGYLRDHDVALRWAKTNRALIARRFVQALGAEAECLWDGCHNSIMKVPSPGLTATLSHPMGEGQVETAWVHRKGAVAVGGVPVVIPGSRGSLSYLVKPIGDGVSHAWSLAHGAGRKWTRSETRLRMRERFAGSSWSRRRWAAGSSANRANCSTRRLPPPTKTSRTWFRTWRSPGSSRSSPPSGRSSLTRRVRFGVSVSLVAMEDRSSRG